MAKITESGFSARAARTVTIDYGTDGPEVPAGWRQKPQRAVKLVLRYTAFSGNLTQGTAQRWDVSATLTTRDVLKSGELGARENDTWNAARHELVQEAAREHLPHTVVTFTETEQ